MKLTNFGPRVAAALVLLIGIICPGLAQQQTQPVMPKLQQTPLPPPVNLPPPPNQPAAVPTGPVTAEEAARIALKNQPDILFAQGAATAAAGRTQQARSGLGPTVSVNAGYNRTQILTGSSSTNVIGGGSGGGGGTGGTGSSGGSFGTSQGYTASATLRQLIFDFGHTRDVVRQASASERATVVEITRAQADAVFNVKQAYYTHFQDLKLVEVNEANLRSAQAELALAEARVRAGLGAPPDVVRAQTTVADAILNLNLARNNASVSRVRLAQLMGVDPRTPIQVSDSHEPNVSSNDVNGMVATALNQRPETVAGRLNVQAAEAGLSAARTTNAPNIGADLGVSTRGNELPPRNSFSTIGVSLAWDPFDSGLTAGRVKEARGALDQNRANLRQAELTVTSDVSQAYLNLRTAEQRVTTAAAEVANAQESLRLAEGRYRAGVGTFIEVTDAQAAVVTASTNQVNAVAAVDVARAALARAIGSGVPR